MSDTVRAAMRDVDPTLPIQEFTSQSEQVSQRFAQERLFALAYAAFGALAVLLACIGLFGLMSYNVARRTAGVSALMTPGRPDSRSSARRAGAPAARAVTRAISATAPDETRSYLINARSKIRAQASCTMPR